MINKLLYLFITPFFPSPERWQGGYCYDAVRAIERVGRYRVVVLTAGAGGDYEYNGIQVHRFPMRQWPCGLVPFLLAGTNRRALLAKLKSLGILGEEVAVCHLNTMGYSVFAPAIKAFAPKAKILLQFHNNAPLTLGAGRLGLLPIHSTLMYLFFRKMYAAADAYVFISRKAESTMGLCFAHDPEETWHDVRKDLWLGRFLPPLVRRASILLYNGVDCSVFACRQQRSAGRPFFTIGNVANCHRLKDPMTLLRAFERVLKVIPDAKLRMIGSGKILPDCRRWAAGHLPAAAYSFEREVDHLQLPEFYRSLDLFVLPSRLDGFGCVCAEANYCGAPFITTNVIGVAETIRDEERGQWLFEPQDDERLAELIVGYWKHPCPQRLKINLDIDGLIEKFLNEVEAL